VRAPVQQFVHEGCAPQITPHPDLRRRLAQIGSRLLDQAATEENRGSGDYPAHNTPMEVAMHDMTNVVLDVVPHDMMPVVVMHDMPPLRRVRQGGSHADRTHD
jgi:hypothetical protein